MYYTYVLYSPQHRKIYIGYTSDLAARLASHNSLATKGYTIRYRPWQLIYQEEFPTKAAAMQKERDFKTARGIWPCSLPGSFWLLL